MKHAERQSTRGTRYQTDRIHDAASEEVLFERSAPPALPWPRFAHNSQTPSLGLGACIIWGRTRAA